MFMKIYNLCRYSLSVQTVWMVVSFNCAIFLSAVFSVEQLVAAKTESQLGGNLGNFFEVTDYVPRELGEQPGEGGGEIRKEGVCISVGTLLVNTRLEKTRRFLEGRVLARNYSKRKIANSTRL